MLFGLPLAVTAFNRLPFLLQALLRRCFALLCSFYYDDATIQDWESTATRSQELVAQVMRLLGYPCAEAKRQGPSVSGDFLGLVHDFSAILTEQRIQVWIRERLQVKIQDFIVRLSFQTNCIQVPRQNSMGVLHFGSSCLWQDRPSRAECT